MAHNLSAQTSSAINPYGLTHTITISYPVKALLDDEESLYLRPRSAALQPRGGPPNNYRPGLPLIREKNVHAHTDRKNREELSIFFRGQVQEFIPDEPNLRLANGYRLQDLVDGLEELQRYRGETELAAVTTFDEHDDVLIRVWRRTRLHRSGGHGDWEFGKVYEFSHIPVESTMVPWVVSLASLIERAAPRDFLHVELMLSLQGWVDPADEQDGFMYDGTDPAQVFKPERRENVGAIIGSLRCVKLDQIASGDLVCNICGSDDFETGTGNSADSDMHAVASGCSNHEVVHKSCLHRLVALQEWPADVTCPQCRQQIFPTYVLRNVEFGLIDGVYHRDPRFTDWENYERSCADLDLLHAEEDATWIEPHGQLLRKIWQEVGFHKQWDDGDRFDAADTPEMQDIRQAVDGWLQQVDPIIFQIRDLYKEGLDLVLSVLANNYLGGDAGAVLSVADRTELLNDPATHLRIAPGVKEHFQRTLSRLLRFFAIRRCNDCFPKKWCRHGERLYFHPWLEHETTAEGLTGEFPVENKESLGEFKRRGAVCGRPWMPEYLPTRGGYP